MTDAAIALLLIENGNVSTEYYPPLGVVVSLLVNARCGYRNAREHHSGGVDQSENSPRLVSTYSNAVLSLPLFQSPTTQPFVPSPASHRPPNHPPTMDALRPLADLKSRDGTAWHRAMAPSPTNGKLPAMASASGPHKQLPFLLPHPIPLCPYIITSPVPGYFCPPSAHLPPRLPRLTLSPRPPRGTTPLPRRQHVPSAPSRQGQDRRL